MMSLQIMGSRETWFTAVIFLSSLVLSQQQDPCATDIGYEYFIENVMENTAVGTELGRLPVRGDDSEVTLTPTEHEFFSFNQTSRVIILNKTLSVDKGAPEIPNYIIKCLAIGVNQREIEISVIIIVKDYNNNAPTFSSTDYTTTISESADVGDTVYSNATATDNDKEHDRNSQVIYSIVPGRYSDYFVLTAATNPTILLAQKLDYENVTQMTIELKAQDRPPTGQPVLSSTATITVNIEDFDDLNPEFSFIFYHGTLPEDASAGTYVMVQPRIEAWDRDSMGVPVVYRLLDPYGMFQISPTAGTIRYIGPMQEGMRQVTVVVLAAQIDNRLREGFALLTITITAANINAPRFSQTLYEVTKTEYEPVGSTLVTTSATDPDFGTVLQYALVEIIDDLSIDQSGNVILLKPLDYEVEREKAIRVTASDGTHTATAEVLITIADVNDNNPILVIPQPVIEVNREEGLIITRVTATDADVNNMLNFTLGSHDELFAINSIGEVSISSPAEELVEDKYYLLITVLDDGDPPRQSSGLLTVKFPSLGPTPTTERVTPEEKDNLLTIILGAAAGALAVIILILIVFIVWKHRRTKEELSKARVPHGHAAKGLTYRQAEAPDDLPKMDLHYTGETDDSDFGGSTTIQENPLRSTAINDGYLQSSGSEMDRDVGEIEINTAVVPYDEEDFGYPSGRSPYLNTQNKTFKGGEDSTSTESSQSDSTGGSRRGLVNNVKQNSNKMTSWDSDDKIHPQGAQKLLDSGVNVNPTKTKKEKPEITVYF